MVIGTVIRCVFGAVFGAIFGFIVGWLVDHLLPNFSNALLAGLHVLTGIGGIRMAGLLAAIGFIVGILGGLLHGIRHRRWFEH